MTQDLFPEIASHFVIFMDNAVFYKRDDMVEAIKEKGYILEYLPSYYSDLNLMEYKWFVDKLIRQREGISGDDTFKKHTTL